jgi:hypothetical protein
MFVVDRVNGEDALAIGNARPVHLRSRSDGQLLELPLGKVTIGSSPRCILRIQKPGVEPVHCLIVHESERLTVRRWATDTQLNGSPFDDAILSAGDCLSLGSVVLEVVADEPMLVSPSQPEPENIPAVEAFDEINSHIEESLELVEASQIEAELPPPPPTVEPEVEPDSDPRHEAEPPLTFAEAAAATPIETVELLFRELQAANGIARGRSRKMLAALRRERAGNEKLVKRLGEAMVQLTDLHRERNDWEKSQWEAMQERRQWDEKVEVLNRQARESEDRFAEQSRLIAELERLVEEARIRAVPMELAPIADASSALIESPVVEPEVYAADAEAASDENMLEQPDEQAPTPEPLVNEWSHGAEHQPAAWDKLPTNVADGESQSVESSTTTSGYSAVDSDPWTPPAEQESAWVEPAAPPQESVAQIWHDLASQATLESPRAIADKTESAQLAGVSSNWGIGSEQKSPTTDEDDLSPFEEFSIWKQDTAEKPASVVEPEIVKEAEAETAAPIWGEGSFDQESEEVSAAADVPVETENPWSTPSATVRDEVVEAPKPKIEPTSFIERYSHMFAEDAAGSISKPIEPIKPPFAETPNSNLFGAGGFREEPKVPAAASTDDEESIEQYMAKLMQRVRGDSPAIQPASTSKAAPKRQPMSEVKVAAAPEAVSEPSDSSPAAEDAANGDDEDDVNEVAVNWDAIARRAAAAPTTNLSALRALANESARHAIGRHQLTKNRRDAVTKAIVSMLAGMTSLWLMLKSSDWHDIQFITGCASLLVAAYWAGVAFRTMLGSLRVAAYDGPKPNVDAGKALPIDVVAVEEAQA